MKGRLKLIDGLRGLAASMVVIYHLGPRNSLRWLTGQGHFGVEIFFVLSGFVIASVIGERRVTSSFFGRFVLRRCVRLDIPYWINIGLAIALGVVVAYFGAPEKIYSLGQIAASLFYVQEILGFREINDVYWTLCYEIQFYLSLLILVACAQLFGRDVRSQTTQCLLILTATISLLCSAAFLPIPRGMMFGYWWAFALGALTFWTVSGYAKPYLLAVMLALSMCLLFRPHEAQRLTCFGVSLTLAAAAYLNRMDRWLSDPIMQFLGRISYSLYLFHPLVGWEAKAFAIRYLHFNVWIAFAFGAATSVISAWVAYLFIERPAVAASRRIKFEPDPVPVNTAAGLG